MKTTLGQKLYVGLALLLLGLYALAELRGWAGGGTKQAPVPQQRLRQADIGYRNHLFWFHGYRGK